MFTSLWLSSLFLIINTQRVDILVVTLRRTFVITWLEADYRLYRLAINSFG
jgi:hypothetical protein